MIIPLDDISITVLDIQKMSRIHSSYLQSVFYLHNYLKLFLT